MPPLRLSVPAAAAVAALAGALAAGPAHAAAPYDFNADGRQDLVVGAPTFKDAGQYLAGAAVVLPGTTRGVALSRLLLAQSTLGDGAQPADWFGSAVASGDFNRDGWSDLAVTDQRGVTVIDGSRNGLDPATARLVPGLGGALVAGDFNGDRFDDLAVGAANEDPTDPDTTELGSGAVHLLFGGPGGISAQGSRTIARPRRADRFFGLELAVGDVNRDGRLDLVEAAQGAPDNTDGDGSPGHAYVFLGTATGPQAGRLPGGSPWTDTGFGTGAPGPTSIAIGDVTGDRYPDVVFGVPAERYREDDKPIPHGQVMVWPGTRTGVASKPIVVDQRSRGVPGANQGGDGFGRAVAVARLDRDRYADIVVGAPGEDTSAGRVTIIRGAASGHATKGNRAFDRATRAVPGRKRVGEQFGFALSLLDVNGDRRRDLVVGSESRARRSHNTVTVFRGPRRGVWSGRGVQRISLRTLGLPDPKVDRLPGSFGAVLGKPGASS